MEICPRKVYLKIASLNELSNQCIIALKKINDWNVYILYGEIYSIITDEYRTIKKVRVSKKGEEYLRLVPVNDVYNEQDIPKSIIRNVFKVVGCVKRIL